MTGMQQAKADWRDGLLCVIVRKSEDKIAASVEKDKDSFPTWEAAEKWVEKMVALKRPISNKYL